MSHNLSLAPSLFFTANVDTEEPEMSSAKVEQSQTEVQTMHKGIVKPTRKP